MEIKPKPWPTIKWDANLKENLDLKIRYDFKLFSKDYLEFFVISKTSIGTSVGVTVSPSESDDEHYGDNPLEWDLLHDQGKVSIPTPVPDLEVIHSTPFSG